MTALNSPYTLKRYDDDAVINPTLAYLFENELGYQLPEFDSNEDDIEAYLEKAEAFADSHGWRILREASLGLMSFQKISMYMDIENNLQRLKSNPVINALAGDSSMLDYSSVQMNNIDSVHPSEVFEVLNADSSQQEAIMCSKQNLSFVMQGPPGTGKSQTIANIISEALSDGKKILFVSEKMAALQVVYKRLQETNLSDFCLPLHSYKANKKDVIEQLGKSLYLSDIEVNHEADSIIESLFIDRNELNSYAEALHKKIEPLGLSVYELYIKLLEIENADNIDFDIPEFDKTGRTQLQAYQRALEKYEEAVINLGFNVKNNPWRNLKNDAVGIEYIRKFSSVLSELHSLYAEIIPISAELETVYHIDEDYLCLDTKNNIKELLKFNFTENIPSEWFTLNNTGDIISALEKLKSESSALKDIQTDIEIDILPEFISYDAEAWLKNVTALLKMITDITNASENVILSEHKILAYRANEISSATENIRKCLSEIKNIFFIGFDCSLDGAESAHSFLSLLLNKKHFIPGWFKNNSPNDIISLAERFRSYTQTIQDFIQKYSDEWSVNIANLDAESIYNRFSKKYNSGYINNQIKKLLGISISDHSELKEKIILIKNSLDEIFTQYDKLNSITKLDLIPSVDNNIVFSKLSDELYSDVSILGEWLDRKTDYKKLINDLNEAQELSKQINSLERMVLEDWDISSFELEYSDILQRFESEYKSILRYFKKAYREDRKNVQALSKKSAPKKISDDNIVKFLTLLKEYKKLSDNLESYDLSIKINTLYKKHNTDWDSVIFGVKTAERISDIIGNINKELSEKICDIKQCHSLAGSIKECTAIINKAHETISTICETFGIKNYNDYNNFSARIDAVINAVTDYDNEYESDISNISKYSKISGSIYSDEYIENLMKDVSMFKRIRDIFSENNAVLCKSFESEYNSINTNWDSIIDSLKTISEIRLLTGNLSSHAIEALCGDISGKAAELHSVLNESLLSIERNKFFRHENAVRKNSLDSIIKDVVKILYCINKLNEACNAILPYFHTPKNTADYFSTIKRVAEYQKQRNICLKLDGFLRLHLNISAFESSTDIDELKKRIVTVSSLKNVIFPDEFYKTVAGNREMRMRLNEICTKLLDSFKKADEKLSWVSKQFSGNDDLKSMPFSQSYERISSFIQYFDQLEFWTDYKIIRKDCINGALKDYILKIEETECFDFIKNTFLKGFYLKLLDSVFFSEPALSGFKRNRHERTIENFRTNDQLQLVAAQARLCSELIRQLPDSNSLIRVNDEVSVLQKELNKRQKLMPLRKLFKKIPNLLIRLKPCLMMSPLSVSYFLEAETYNFDLVIFDEASQILPEDAIGAILRGKQVIIAGDVKQMPPTSFFSSSVSVSDIDTENDEDNEDIISASILEEAAGILPSKTLLWHYRSRHEGLIAFANSEIYDNKLITFPNNTVYRNDMGVEYIYVEDGVYEGGGRNCNEKEAKECVKLLHRHITEHPERSLGIIAFSEKQQGVIQREVDNFRMANPQYEFFFKNDSDEPFFVKNLENVQGDERDTIIFSICYAKDANGRLYMRFGPLGQQGGEKRLNVAVTRAKCNIKLVGSLLPDEFDLNRVKSEGVKMLRRYIEYAVYGESRLRNNQKLTTFSKDSFCDIVSEYIVSEGFEIKRNVGCSDNKIDIVVINPDNDKEYLAGIECDGYSYKKAKTARDRDSLRFSVLERMGWKMYRVWSTEWITNEISAKKQLLDFLNNVLKNVESADSARKLEMTDLIKTVEKPQETPDTQAAYGLSAYTVTPYSMLKPVRNIYDYSTIAENIMCILSYEQPVSINLVYKRLAASFGIEKMTAKYKTSVVSAIRNELSGKVILDDRGFMWSTPKQIPLPKIPSDAESLRKIDDISIEEISELMKIVLSKAYGLDINDLISECSAVFGYERRGAKINSIMNQSVELLRNKRLIETVDGKIRMI